LLASATRLYGNDMSRLWGTMLPVPSENVRVLVGGESIGDVRVAATPGHASHHLAFLHEPTGWAFVGDVGGVRISPSTHIVMPTPPPDIDLPAWRSSLDLVGDWRPTALAPTHFGVFHDVDTHLHHARSELEAWSDLAQQVGADAFRALVIQATAKAVDEETAAAYEQAAPTDHLHPGLARFWTSQAAEAAEA
jgi:glyoxylase-like metal-dependent hydrolase (beta-lactamase superfamily II)